MLAWSPSTAAGYLLLLAGGDLGPSEALGAPFRGPFGMFRLPELICLPFEAELPFRR